MALSGGGGVKVQFGVKGFRDLDRALARISAAMTPEVVEAALVAGAEEIAQEARKLAPVDTGTLRDSIQVVSSREGMRLYLKSQADGATVYVGPVGSDEDGDVYYARYIEFGTSRHAPNPFLRPAIAAKADAAGLVTVRRLQKVILEAAK